jgi:hypothetical protein
MSKEEKLNKEAKITVLTPIVLLLVGLLLFSSCARQKCIYAKSYKKSNLCPAYR